MKNLPHICLVISLVCMVHTGCAIRPASTLSPDQPAFSSLPPPEPGHDHYIAWVPGDRAQTATVARTLTHISLGRARALAGIELCAGASLVSGDITSVQGPVPALNPQRPDAGPAWYYRISLQPGLHGCESQSQTSLYRALQGNLPDWITLETASSAAFTGLLQSAR